MTCKVNKKKQHGKVNGDKLGAPRRRPSVFRWLLPFFKGSKLAPRHERCQMCGDAIFAHAAKMFFRLDNSFGAEITI